VDVTPTPNFDLPATFDGIRRADGRVATRNYIGILTSVNCSAHVAGMVADIFKKNPFTGDNPLADFPNVDGVVALTHKTGCGMTQDEPLRAACTSALCAACEFLLCGRRARLGCESPDWRPDAGTKTRLRGCARWYNAATPTVRPGSCRSRSCGSRDHASTFGKSAQRMSPVNGSL